MPKCSEGYVSEHINQLMRGRGVLEVAQTVHMSCTGAYEYSNINDQLNDISILWFYINHWTEPGSLDPVYDNLVKELIKRTLLKVCEYDNG